MGLMKVTTWLALLKGKRGLVGIGGCEKLIIKPQIYFKELK